MGGGPSSSKTPGLADCADCAILAQTLCRLRQNLAASRQSSPSDAQELRDTLPIADRTLPLPRTVGTTVYNRPEAVSNARVCPLNTARQHHDNDSSNNRRRSSAAPEQPLPATNILSSARPAPQSFYTNPLQLRNKVSFHGVVHTPDGKDPEAYYRGHGHYGRFQGYPTLRTKQSMPPSSHISKPQEQRRPSNHTDDRDWMA